MSWFSSSDQHDSQPDPEGELRSLELFTPTGADRTMALSVLRRFTEATAAGRTDEAQSVLDAVEPEAPSAPTMPQVLGASVGLLDTWFADRRHRPALTSVRAAARRRPVRACATDLLAAARKHAAYASLDDLSIRHGGLAMFEAAATLIASCVAAIAKRQRLSVPRACRDLLIADADYAGAKVATQGRDTGYSGFTPADDRMAQAFLAWLAAQDVVSGPGGDQEIEVLQSILALTRIAGIDLHNPNDMDAVVAMVADLDADEEAPEDASTVCLLTLDDYVHFQQERTRSPEAWDMAHDVVEAELEGPDDEEVMTEAIDATRGVDPAIRHRTLMATRAVTAVADLLAWLGEGRPITPTGNLRRADIEPVAAMLGIRAEGVRTRPAEGAQETPADIKNAADADVERPLPDPPVYYALTLPDVPVLYAWWRALSTAGITRLTTSRVYPGPRAAEWLSGQGPQLGELETFVSLVVAMVLDDGMERRTMENWQAVLQITVNAAGRALVAATEGLELPDAAAEENRWKAPGALQKLAWIQQLGLLETDSSGEFRAPEGARSAVATGALSEISTTAAEFEEPDWDEGLYEGWDEGLLD